jgi:hypothetical protein
MKNFLFNTPFGVIIVMIILLVMALVLSITASLLIWGGGIMIFNDIYNNDVINVMILRTATTLWTLINIVLFVLITAWLFIQLMVDVNERYNMAGNRKDKADREIRDK